MTQISTVEYLSEILKFTAVFFALFEMLPLAKRNHIEGNANKYLRDFNYFNTFLSLAIALSIIWFFGNDGAFIFKFILIATGVLYIISTLLAFIFFQKTANRIDISLLIIIITLFLIGLVTPRGLLEILATPYNSFVELAIKINMPLNKINILELIQGFDNWIIEHTNPEDLKHWYVKSQAFIGSQIFDASILLLLLTLSFSILYFLFWSITSLIIFPFWSGLKIAHKLKSLLSLEEKHGIPIFGFLLWATGEVIGFSVKTYEYFT